MIYQFGSSVEVFAIAPSCKRWRWQIDGARVLAYLEPEDGVDSSGWVLAAGVPDATRAWLEKK